MESKELRQDVLDYILKEAEASLRRLGVYTKLEVTANLGTGYRLTSSPIKLIPAIFKALYVSGDIWPTNVEDDSGWKQVKIRLEYRWASFSNGSNSTEIGNMVFKVYSNIPDGGDLSMYVRKLYGIEI